MGAVWVRSVVGGVLLALYIRPNVRSITREQALWAVLYARHDQRRLGVRLPRPERRAARNRERDPHGRPARGFRLGAARHPGPGAPGRRGRRRRDSQPCPRHDRRARTDRDRLRARGGGVPRRIHRRWQASRQAVRGPERARHHAPRRRRDPDATWARARQAGDLGTGRPRDARRRRRPGHAHPVRTRDDRVAEPVDGNVRAAAGVRARDREHRRLRGARPEPHTLAGRWHRARRRRCRSDPRTEGLDAPDRPIQSGTDGRPTNAGVQPTSLCSTACPSRSSLRSPRRRRSATRRQATC